MHRGIMGVAVGLLAAAAAVGPPRSVLEGYGVVGTARHR